MSCFALHVIGIYSNKLASGNVISILRIFTPTRPPHCNDSIQPVPRFHAHAQRDLPTCHQSGDALMHKAGPHGRELEQLGRLREKEFSYYIIIVQIPTCNVKHDHPGFWYDLRFLRFLLHFMLYFQNPVDAFSKSSWCHPGTLEQFQIFKLAAAGKWPQTIY